MFRPNKRTSEFKRSFAKLPKSIQELAFGSYSRFKTNPAHPALAMHQLKDTKRGRHRPGSWAVSVGTHYRALYVVEGEFNLWYWIGTHENYNNFVGLK